MITWDKIEIDLERLANWINEDLEDRDTSPYSLVGLDLVNDFLGIGRLLDRSAEAGKDYSVLSLDEYNWGHYWTYKQKRFWVKGHFEYDYLEGKACEKQWTESHYEDRWVRSDKIEYKVKLVSCLQSDLHIAN